MTARSTAEEHRVSTPLELLFDLCFAVAVAAVIAATFTGQPVLTTGLILAALVAAAEAALARAPAR